MISAAYSSIIVICIILKLIPISYFSPEETTHNEYALILQRMMHRKLTHQRVLSPKRVDRLNLYLLTR